MQRLSAPIMFILFCTAFLFLGNSANSKLLSTPKNSFLWFDLGNVIVDTRQGLKNLKYMPGAFKYLRNLRRRGYRIGVITNIPESWGKPGDRRSKIAFLEKLMQKGWKGKYPFSLYDFDEVLVPLFDKERKPEAKLFLDAIGLAEKEGKLSVFQGETDSEVLAARRYGMKSFQVSVCTDCGKNKTEKTVYLPVRKIP